MIILGIDPGFALVGWAIVEKKRNPKLIAFGCIKTNKNSPQEKRFLRIFKELEQIIKNHKPDVICLENLFFNTNAKTAFAVGEARGIIKICGLLNKLSLTEFTPLQIKSTITGYGRADKNQIQQMIKTLLDLKEIPKPDDAADAVAVALTYCFYNQNLEE